MKPMEARRNELLASVATTAAEQARSFGMAADQAEQLGASVADALAEDWGGQNIYVPNRAGFRLSPRDRAILDTHRNGTSVASLAKEYSMSEQGIRQLLRRAAQRDSTLDQMALFDQGG